ncbi:hypothetical protein D3C80_1370450 [compost metagenome]
MLGLPVTIGRAGIALGQDTAQFRLAKRLVERCMGARVLARQLALDHQQRLFQRQQHGRRIAAQGEHARLPGIGKHLVQQARRVLARQRAGHHPGKVTVLGPGVDSPLILEQGIGVLGGGH